MKIKRYTCPNGYENGKWIDIHAYAYIWANPIERYFLNKLIVDGKHNLRKHPYRGSVTSAHYILVPKKS